MPVTEYDRPVDAGSYVIYLRKSRADLEAEAHGEGETLARHERELLALARRLRLNIVDIYREIVSGETIAARPVMQKLLTEVENGLWDGVLVMEVERLARGDTIDQGIVAQTFKFAGTRIITPSKSYDPSNEFDEEYFEFGLFMSRREYKTINRRLQRGRLASVKEGKFVASIPPYGYQRKKLEREKGYTLVPDPEQAPVVEMIFKWYAYGERQPDGSMQRLGVSRITNKLNASSYKPQKGGEWSAASIRDMLINPVYIGKIRWDWRKTVKRRSEGGVVASRPHSPEEQWTMVDGLHPPLIDQATFHTVQELMSHNRAPSIRVKGVVQNPLAGLVICGKCGRTMQRRPYQSGRVETILCPYTTCDNISSDLPVVEARVLSSLREWADEYALQWESSQPSTASTVPSQRKMAQKLSDTIANLEKQRDNLHDLLERGVYDADTFLTRSRNIAARIDQALRDREALLREIDQTEQMEASRQVIIPKIRTLLEVYDTLPTPQAKNDMLKEVLERVVYLKTERCGLHGDPNRFQLTVYPKIPEASVNS